MFKTILVHVDSDDPGSRGRLQCAKELARQSHAALLGVAARLSPATLEMLASGGAAAMTGGGPLDAPGDLATIFAASKAQFDACLAGSGLASQWRTISESPTPALADIAAAADLLVVGQTPARDVFDGFNAVDAGELVMRAGRPVLVIPPAVGHLDLGNVVVAWKNTRESQKALTEALPLLAAAEAVTLVHVREAKDADDVFAAAKAFLDQHAIAAAGETIEAGGSGAGAALQAFASRALAGLVVAGAYGHNRLREWAFGGVTRDVLFRLPVPAFLSH